MTIFISINLSTNLNYSFPTKNKLKNILLNYVIKPN